MEREDSTLIRKKFILVKDISQVIKDLHFGKIQAIPPLLDEMRSISQDLDEESQNDITLFALQVEFQMDYDPFHLVTEEIRKAGDALINDLGFHLPHNEKEEK